MTNKQQVVIFSVLASVSAVTTTVVASNPNAKHFYIILPLVLMGVFLFIAGYYAGRIRK